MTANKLEGKARELLAECSNGRTPRSDGLIEVGQAVDAIVRALGTARQSEGMVDADEIFRLNSRLVEETNRADRAEAELAEYKKDLTYLIGYRKAVADMKKYLDSKQ